MILKETAESQMAHYSLYTTLLLTRVIESRPLLPPALIPAPLHLGRQFELSLRDLADRCPSKTWLVVVPPRPGTVVPPRPGWLLSFQDLAGRCLSKTWLAVVLPRPGWTLSFQDLVACYPSKTWLVVILPRPGWPTNSQQSFISYWQAEVENYVCVREITKLGSSVPYQLIFFIIGAHPWLVISQTHTRRLACISLNAGPSPSSKAVLRQ